jgi:hypothetical protein
MSAIPWVGQDIVESKITGFALYSALSVCAPLKSGNNVLPKLGITNLKSRANRSKWLSESEYLSIPKSFIAFLVGFIDGDGYILINNTRKDFLGIKLVISVHIDDIAILNYIQSVLKIGKLSTYPNLKSPSARLIFSKTDLQEILFPLMIYHGIYFLTETRRTQFYKALQIIVEGIKSYSQIPKTVPELQALLNSASPQRGEAPRPGGAGAKGYFNLPFLKDWLVGFVAAEGSFFVKSNKDACFQIKQRLHMPLFEAFKLVFNTTRKISVDNSLYVQFSVSYKADIQNVINFFSFSGHHPLIGLKGIQYSAWLENLRNSERYGGLNFPD